MVSSFGKTYHVTGWKVGYCVAPPALTTEFRRVHQFVNFTVNTPVQYGLADFLRRTASEHHLQLPDFYQAKRDLFCELLAPSRFTCYARVRHVLSVTQTMAIISSEQDVALAKRWTAEMQGRRDSRVGVLSGHERGSANSLLRFCFAKDDATLAAAAEILCSL